MRERRLASQFSSCVAAMTRVATSGSIGSSKAPSAIFSRKRSRKRATVSATLSIRDAFDMDGGTPAVSSDAAGAGLLTWSVAGGSAERDGKRFLAEERATG